MILIHGLSPVLEDQIIASPTFSYWSPNNFHFDRTKALNLDSFSLCSFGATISYRDKHKTCIRIKIVKLLRYMLLDCDMTLWFTQVVRAIDKAPQPIRLTTQIRTHPRAT